MKDRKNADLPKGRLPRGPVLPAHLQKEPVSPSSLMDIVRRAEEEGDTVTGCLFSQEDLEEVSGSVLDFSGCVFQHVRFSAPEPVRIHFTDCCFEDCDFSSFSFRDGSIIRCSVTGSRGAGMNMENMNLRDVTVENCLLRYAGFVDCQFQDALFASCQMRQALFHRCRQKNLIWRECSLEEAEIQETQLNQIDLSTCTITGIRTSVSCLQGTSISLDQAPSVLSLCGIRVT